MSIEGLDVPAVERIRKPLGHARAMTIAIWSFCLIGAALFLFSGIASFPLLLWDESRLAVNALEMSLTGFRLQTTYDFHADLWNTKPPLQIWLMALALRVVPDAEVAIRLPSVVAALGTLLLTAAFVLRVTRSAFAAFLGGALLLASRGFHGEHRAFTGDYDSLMVFFATAYLSLFFVSLHRRKVGTIEAVLIGACIAGAVLTKGVAGLIPGVGVAVYVTVANRWSRLLRRRAYIFSVLAAIVPVAGFYLARETVGQGYIDAVVANEIL